METRDSQPNIDGAVNDDVPKTEPTKGGDVHPEQTAMTMMGTFIADLSSVTNRAVEDFYYFVRNSQGEEAANTLMGRLEDAVGRIPGGTQAFRTVQQVMRGVETKNKAEQIKKDVLSGD